MVRLFFDVNRTGSRLEQVPRCFYDYVTVYNNTRYDFTLFKGLSTSVTDIIGACPAYTLITFPHDKLTDTVNFVWEGDTSPLNERCKIFFTEENLALVGEFRPPQISPIPPPVPTPQDRRLFAGLVSTGTILTATSKIIIRAIYIANTAATASNITMSHRRSGIDTTLLPNISIPNNHTQGLGYFVLEAGDSIFVNAFTGTFNISIYGEGS